MRRTYVTAIIIAIAVGLWLASGQLREEPPAPPATLQEQNLQARAMMEERPPTRVRVSLLHATDRMKVTTVRGRTENKRTVDVRAQINGTLSERPVERGDQVAAGDLLCSISVDDRQASVSEATEMLNQARIDYEGSLKLSSGGFQSKTLIAQAKARLAGAEASLKRAQLNLDRLSITAPFDGVVEDVHLEQGDYVTPGASCVTLVDLDPMLLVGQVSENEIAHIEVGAQAQGYLTTGQLVTGPVTFISSTADEITRTYGVEVQVPNADFAIPSGLSVRIDVPMETVRAQKVSPALFSLDDEGLVGLKALDEENTVRFHYVEIVADAEDGVWVTGLPERATVITVGQEMVVAGETVEPVYSTD